MAVQIENLRNGMRMTDDGENFRDRVERPELGIVATHLDVLLAAISGGGGGGGDSGKDPSVP